MNRVLLSISLPLLICGCVSVERNNEPEIDSQPQEKALARIAVGMGYLQQGNMLKARENLELAYQYAPNFYRSQLSLAHYYEHVGEHHKALNLYQTSLRQHPSNGHVLNNFGTFLCKQGEYQRADEYFNRAILQPNYYLLANSYENAAFCALKAGDKQQAMGYFSRALDYDPARYRSVLNLAKLEVELDKLMDARLRLIQFNQNYGVREDSVRLMIALEQRAGNLAMVEKYQAKLAQMTDPAHHTTPKR